MRLGIIRLERKRCLKTGDRFFRPAHILQRVTDIVVRFWIIGFEVERSSIAGNRRVRCAECCVHDGRVEMRCRHIGLEFDGPGDEIGGGFVVSQLVCNSTEQMQSDGLIGIPLQ